MKGEALSGERIAISRVAGQPPSTSTPAFVPGGQRITVQPVIAVCSVACPTRKPGTSVSIPLGTAGSGAPDGSGVALV